MKRCGIHNRYTYGARCPECARIQRIKATATGVLLVLLAMLVGAFGVWVAGIAVDQGFLIGLCGAAVFLVCAGLAICIIAKACWVDWRSRE